MTSPTLLKKEANTEELERKQKEAQLRFTSLLLILSSMFHVALHANKLNLSKDILVQV
jgi:hypothetical protein